MKSVLHLRASISEIDENGASFTRLLRYRLDFEHCNAYLQDVQRLLRKNIQFTRLRGFSYATCLFTFTLF